MIEQQISPYAKKVIQKLNKAGFKGYLVGGGVRDCLLGVTPKDFDVVTNARPEEIKSVFSNCRLIGRRFRLAHIYFGDYIIEVATFRSANDLEDTGIVRQDNVYGDSLQEDAKRRDFTINALYYDLENATVVDEVGGLSDLDSQIIRLIGEPQLRYQQDPLRLLRAIRFSAKLDFKIESNTQSVIAKMGYLLEQVAPARLFEEYIKLFCKGAAVKTFALLEEYGLLPILFPTLQKKTLIHLALESTDLRIQENKPISPAFLIAVFLWSELIAQKNAILKKQSWSSHQAFIEAMSCTLSKQKKIMSMPRRYTDMIKDIWFLQIALCSHQGRKVGRLYHHPRFRAGYDFLLLRAVVLETPHCVKAAKWWTDYNKASESQKSHLAKLLQGAKK